MLCCGVLRLLSFGVKDTLTALESGAVEELIVWESLDIQRYLVKNKDSGADKVLYLNEKQEKDSSSFKDGPSELEVVDKISLLEWLANNFKSFGAKLQFTNANSTSAQPHTPPSLAQPTDRRAAHCLSAACCLFHAS